MKNCKEKIITRRYFSRNEILLNNAIDKDFQSVLRPLNIMQAILFQLKYRIRDNFITCNDTTTNALLFFGTIIIILTNLIESVISTSQFIITKLMTLFICIVFNFFFYAIGLVGNAVINYRGSKSNVEFVLKMQAVRNITKSFGDQYFSLSLWNWIYVLLIIGYNIAFSLYFRIKFGAWSITFLICFCFDVNTIYAIRVVMLLKTEVSLLNSQLKYNSKRSNLSESVERYETLFCNKMFKAYSDIIQAFNIFKNNFQFMVTFHTVDTFIHALVYIECMIVMSKDTTTKESLAPLSGSILIWIVKSLALQVIIGITCETFYVAVENSQTSCKILVNKCTDTKQFFKNICRAHDAGFSKLSGCGMFAVDATLPLQLLSSVTSYTIVLLQFAQSNV